MANMNTKHAALQALTANLLLSGDVVYWSCRGDWSLNIQDALLAATEDEVAILEARIPVEENGNDVVAPYLFPVERDEDGTIQAISQREVIRAKGPTIRTDLGKQSGLRPGPVDQAA
ncbi:MAG: DUF2849 domain-containing protein [Alphaproteobacteria bacterium]